MEKTYNPKEVEEKILEFWLNNDFYSSYPDETKKAFTIVIPPPNVTGALHMGHALNNTLQDVIIRYKRMCGYNALWVPGTDHGGIATQNVVEKNLLKQNLTRQKLGREKFLEVMWNWKNESGDRIITQLKRLGCSCHWDRLVFTMDEKYSRAVINAFVILFNKGLIYRGKRIVNWCVRCQTALADIEVEHKQIKGYLWYIKYPLKQDYSQKNHRYIVVATTRPETMLGDVAVAVNPKDNRYKNYIGKIVILPLMEREIPIIEDEAVDMDFGTGAVKVTPAHDPIDFEIAQRKNLNFVFVIDYSGKMTEETKKYKWLDRYECRQKIIDDLKKENLLEKIEDYTYSVGVCYRCSTIIEPIISEQWFLNVSEMSKKAIRAIENGDIKFHPEFWKDFCIDWLNNLKDWCISRQIWWGHRIPVFYCQKGCKPIASVDEIKKCPNCNSEVKQDEDVLDTWFSSALWPFGVFNWPDKTLDLNYYYPTSVLVTGYEILYFWVARMIQMGLTFTDNVPFRDVYIHGIVRDVHGRKMSKSLGNIIDPLEIINEYGTDALRFSLTESSGAGKDIHLSLDSFVGARNLMNKLHNAARYIFETTKDTIYQEMKNEDLSFVDKWILLELSELIGQVNSYYDSYRLDKSAHLLYDFFWKKYCDWYIELSKVNLAKSLTLKEIKLDYSKSTESTLIKTFEIILRLFHPIIPFITEEIWQKLKDKMNLPTPSIMISKFPTQDEIKVDFNEEDRQKMNYLIKITNEVRSIKGEFKLPLKKEITLYVYSKNENLFNTFPYLIPYLYFLAKVKEIKKLDETTKIKNSVTILVDELTMSIPLEEIDFAKEVERIKRELETITSLMENYSKKLQNENFLKNAPQKEIERTKQKYSQLTEKKQKLQKILQSM